MADDIVKEAMEAFELAQEAEQENRDDAREDIEFGRLSCQWPERVRKEREAEGRPCLTMNKLQPTIRQVVNDSRMNRPATSVHPVDSKADKDTAEVLTGIIRNIEVSSDADVAYDTAVECAVAGGFGYWRINTDYALNAMDEDGIREMGESAFDQNLFIRAVPNQFSVYGDPYSQAADSSDWMTAFVVDLMSNKQFKARYPDAEVTDFETRDWSELKEPWISGETVQVAEYWKRERQVKNAYAVQLGGMDMPGDVVVMFEDELNENREAIIQGGGQVIGQPRPIATFKVTQFTVSGLEVLKTVDWPGAYIPIVPVYGDEVNLEGKRHFRSLIRDAKDAQQKYNYWSTQATEMVALAPRVPYIGPKGAFETDKEKWATANNQSHAYIEYDGQVQPQRQQFSGLPAGALQEALTASDEIKAITGIYDASLGARSNETSGVAINARKIEGDVATFHFIDNLTRAIRHSGRIMVDLIPKVYSTPRIVRILGEDGKSEERRINQEYEDRGTMRIHDVRTGRYDVVVKAGPGFTTRREEAAAQMMDLIKAYPDAAPIIGDLLIKNLDWQGADEIAARLEKMLPPNLREEGQIPPELQQQMQQMAQAMQKMQQALQEAQDTKDIDARKVAVDEYKAATERMKEVAAIMDPTVFQAIVGGLVQDLAATEATLQPNFPSGSAAPFGQAA